MLSCGPTLLSGVGIHKEQPENRRHREARQSDLPALILGSGTGIDLGGLLPDIESLFEEFDGEWGTAFGCPDGDCPWRHLLEGLLGDRHLLER